MKGLEQVWFFGDGFSFNSYEKYYFQSTTAKQGYAMQNYEITGFMNNGSSSLDKNVVSRLRNLLAEAIKKMVYLPKVIVIVPDDDIITYVGDEEVRTSYIYARVLDRFRFTLKGNLR